MQIDCIVRDYLCEKIPKQTDTLPNRAIGLKQEIRQFVRLLKAEALSLIWQAPPVFPQTQSSMYRIPQRELAEMGSSFFCLETEGVYTFGRNLENGR